MVVFGRSYINIARRSTQSNIERWSDGKGEEIDAPFEAYNVRFEMLYYCHTTNSNERKMKKRRKKMSRLISLSFSHYLLYFHHFSSIYSFYIISCILIYIVIYTNRNSKSNIIPTKKKCIFFFHFRIDKIRTTTKYYLRFGEALTLNQFPNCWYAIEYQVRHLKIERKEEKKLKYYSHIIIIGRLFYFYSFVILSWQSQCVCIRDKRMAMNER